MSLRDRLRRPPANGTPADRPAQTPPRPPAIRDYQPFPVDALPWRLKEFVEENSRAVDCDPAYTALPALTVAGAAAGAAVVASPKRRFLEPPALWTCTVGDSGTGKSPGLAPAVALAFGIDRDLLAAYTAAVRQYMADAETWAEGDCEGEKQD